MMTMWKKSAISLVFVGSIAACFAACGGGGFSCDEKGRCPNDTAPPQTAIDQCNALLNDAKCGAKFEALSSCEAKQPASCGADGKSQMANSPACKMQNDDYSTCLFGGGLDGGSG